MIPYQVYDQFNIGNIKIYTWGFLLALAFCLGLFLFLHLSKKEKLNIALLFNLGIFSFLGALVGAKLGYLLQFSSFYLSQPQQIFNNFSAGLTFYGGLIGGVVVGWLVVRRYSLNFKQIADLAVLPLSLGIFIGRLGCLLINDHIGKITTLPWAIVWPDGALRHPVALYLSLNGLLMFFLFLFLRKKLASPGKLWLGFLVWYSAMRFFLDFTRTAEPQLAEPHYLFLSYSQWLSFFIFLIAVSFILFNKTPLFKKGK